MLLPLRWLLYTVIKNPLLVLPTQVLHSAGMLSLLVAGGLAYAFVHQQGENYLIQPVVYRRAVHVSALGTIYRRPPAGVIRAS